ncbi:MAG: glycosyltransferase [Ignavibacteriales bacterium]|nr:glycosyltransferase [Ignavibacteriales bacterium]
MAARKTGRWTASATARTSPPHGIDVQPDAAARLKNRADIRFTFVGKGQLYPEMRARAEAYAGLPDVRFIEWISHAELVELIARADVCLGIFGRTEKAARAIPGKACEALAMRKPLITGDSPASRDGLTDGVTALLSPMGDPDGLAAAIARLAGDEGLRRRIAEGGHAFFKEKCTSSAKGETILADLKRRWPESFKPAEPDSARFIPPRASGPARGERMDKVLRARRGRIHRFARERSVAGQGLPGGGAGQPGTQGARRARDRARLPEPGGRAHPRRRARPGRFAAGARRGGHGPPPGGPWSAWPSPCTRLSVTCTATTA